MALISEFDYSVGKSFLPACRYSVILVMDSEPDLIQIQLRLKPEHVKLLDLLKQEYGASSRSRVLEMLLDELLDVDESPDD